MASSARIDELKKKFDDNPRRYFAPLANEFRKAGDIEQAILICEEFLPQQPGHMSGHIVYGQALYEAGRMPESRTVFETALSLDPENLIALRHLGDIARGQDDAESARTWYARVLDADPRNEEIQALIASLGDDGMAASNASGAAAPSAPAAGGDDFAEPMELVDQDAVTQQSERFAPSRLPESPSADTAAPAMVDLSFDDTMPTGMPAIPAPHADAGAELHVELPQATGDDAALLDFGMPGEETSAEAPASGSSSASYLDVPTEPMQAFTLEGLQATAAEAEHAGESMRAEGLEPAEFMAPDEPVESLELDDSLESGVPEFDAPSAAGVAALDGLEDSSLGAAMPAEALDSDSLEALDIDGGLIPPAEEARDANEAAAAEEAPAELPAAVIAAEAELIESGETPAPEMPADDVVMAEEASAPVAAAPFLTETMADLYLAQGFHDQAVSVFRQLVDASPDDARLRGRLESLTAPAQIAVPTDEGPSVRDFFARFANRRPGATAAHSAPPSEHDFAEPDAEPDAEPAAEPDAAPDAAPEPAPESEPEAGQASAPESVAEPVAESAPVALEQAFDDPDLEARVEEVLPPTGSIDALFGAASTTSEDSAASALAQAFASEPEQPAPAIAGRPARAAAGELSLDSVFRDGSARPPRTSQSFSFDQFFSEGASQPGGQADGRPSELQGQAEAPAERSAEDVEHFNSWLQGLKQK